MPCFLPVGSQWLAKDRMVTPITSWTTCRAQPAETVAFLLQALQAVPSPNFRPLCFGYPCREQPDGVMYAVIQRNGHR